jgi:hypothetical protein
VCTKSCNKLVKARNSKNKAATEESKMFNIVTCEATKQARSPKSTPATGTAPPILSPSPLLACHLSRLLLPLLHLLLSYCNLFRKVICEKATCVGKKCPAQGKWTVPGGGCKTSTSFTAKAVCPFSSRLWSFGPTCITNHVHGPRKKSALGRYKYDARYPQCPDSDFNGLRDLESNPMQGIAKNCRKPTLLKSGKGHEEDVSCTRVALIY